MNNCIDSVLWQIHVRIYSSLNYRLRHANDFLCKIDGSISTCYISKYMKIQQQNGVYFVDIEPRFYCDSNRLWLSHAHGHGSRVPHWKLHSVCDNDSEKYKNMNEIMYKLLVHIRCHCSNIRAEAGALSAFRHTCTHFEYMLCFMDVIIIIIITHKIRVFEISKMFFFFKHFPLCEKQGEKEWEQQRRVASAFRQIELLLHLHTRIPMPVYTGEHPHAHAYTNAAGTHMFQKRVAGVTSDGERFTLHFRWGFKSYLSAWRWEGGGIAGKRDEKTTIEEQKQTLTLPCKERHLCLVSHKRGHSIFSSPFFFSRTEEKITILCIAFMHDA